MVLAPLSTAVRSAGSPTSRLSSSPIFRLIGFAQFGMFLHDPDSNLCWFNPAAVGMEEDFWMVGVIVGLAVYNEATLDVPLPLVSPQRRIAFLPQLTIFPTQAAYKKLASEALTLRDLAQIQPALARGLQQLLDYNEGDVEGTFLRSFVGTYEAWGEVVEVELVEGGAEVAVTEENRKGASDTSC